MRLQREQNGTIVLYDDHGDRWTITLEKSGRFAHQDPAGASMASARPARFIRFEGEEGSFEVPFHGDHDRTAELDLSEVVSYFID